MFDRWEDFPRIITNDFLELFCGDFIGKGVFRQVYDCAIDDSLIIKIEYSDSRLFCNCTEWNVWNTVKGTEFEKYFAPCVKISMGGQVLLMKKTQPLKKYPEKIPAFFTDTKRANYGKYNGSFCCHDYAGNFLIEKGMTKRLVKADWWD